MDSLETRVHALEYNVRKVETHLGLLDAHITKLIGLCDRMLDVMREIVTRVETEHDGKD